MAGAFDRIESNVRDEYMVKVNIPLEPPENLSEEEKRDWKRDKSLIIRPIVVITTMSKRGIPNAAIKTNFMVSSSLREVAFACSKEHDTAKNILETKEFVVNVPSEEIVKETFVTAISFPHDVNELEKAGLTAIPSEKVKPPRIKECKAHFECVLKWHKEDIFVGRVVAASADDDVLKGNIIERQKNLRQMFVVGAKEYGLIGKIKKMPPEDLKRV